jgi:hypothetical protein
MPPPLARVVRHLRRLARPAIDPADDRALLAAFTHRRDEAAFAELVLGRRLPTVKR